MTYFLFRGNSFRARSFACHSHFLVAFGLSPSIHVESIYMRKPVLKCVGAKALWDLSILRKCGAGEGGLCVTLGKSLNFYCLIFLKKKTRIKLCVLICKIHVAPPQKKMYQKISWLPSTPIKLLPDLDGKLRDKDGK